MTLTTATSAQNELFVTINFRTTNNYTPAGGTQITFNGGGDCLMSDSVGMPVPFDRQAGTLLDPEPPTLTPPLTKTPSLTPTITLTPSNTSTPSITPTPSNTPLATTVPNPTATTAPAAGWTVATFTGAEIEDTYIDPAAPTQTTAEQACLLGSLAQKSVRILGLFSS
jgi:hypothetical protein